MSSVRKTLNVLGLDPSLRSTGVFLGKATIAANGKPQLEPYEHEASVATITTKKADKTAQYVNVHDVAEAASAFYELARIVADYNIDVIYCETPVGSQSAAAMKGYGVCVGWIGALKAIYPQIPIMHLRAKDLKVTMTGNPEATKNDMVQAAVALIPNAGWSFRNKKDKVTGEMLKIASIDPNQHSADALAAAVAGINSPAFAKLVTT